MSPLEFLRFTDPGHHRLGQPSPARPGSGSPCLPKIRLRPPSTVWHGMALMCVGCLVMLAKAFPYPGIPVSRAGAVTSRVLGALDGAVRTPMWIRHDMLVGLLSLGRHRPPPCPTRRCGVGGSRHVLCVSPVLSCRCGCTCIPYSELFFPSHTSIWCCWGAPLEPRV